MSFNLTKYIEQKQKKIQISLESFLKTAPYKSVLIDAMRYSLTSNGKRIRPILLMTAYELLGGKEEDVLDIACAIEMIHTYSLIHDDLPAMDDDALRRGMATCHIKFNEAIAILAGDSLLTYAFEILSSHKKKHSSSKLLKVINLISKSAGLSGMIEGQVRDISFENKKISLKELEALHSLKTGALIEASIVSAPILLSSTAKQTKALKKYAKCIGIAFQIKDDILDVEGDSKVIGKMSGSDEKLNKSTYPSLIGLDESKKLSKKMVNEAIKSLLIFEEKKIIPLVEIAKYIDIRKK